VFKPVPVSRAVRGWTYAGVGLVVLAILLMVVIQRANVALPVAPTAAPSDSPSRPQVATYRVVNVAFLNLRGGPDETYPVVVRIRGGTGGIRLGASRVRNGSTFWRKISVGPYTGWVNEVYIEAETESETGQSSPVRLQERSEHALDP
jgi:uncharacterized protein YraI